MVHWQIRQPYHACVRSSSDEQELAEIVVERDQDSVFGCRLCQECRVAWIVLEFSGVEDVVPLFRNHSASRRPAQQSTRKPHRLSTETAASVSPAITACA